MGLSNNTEFQKLLSEAIESHLLQEHLSLHLKKSTSPLSQDYLTREQVTEVKAAPIKESKWARRELPQSALLKIELLENELELCFPEFFTSNEAAKYLSTCLKQAHPDTNPKIALHVFQKIFPICQDLKNYFKNLKDRKKPRRSAFTAPYQK